MRFLLHFVLGMVATTATVGELPIPYGQLGYVYNHGLPSASSRIVAYIDLTDNFSKESYQTLLQLDKMFQPNDLQLRFLPFSLPFHRHSHTIAKGAYIIHNFSSRYRVTVFDWIQAVYDHIKLLTTEATVNQTDTEIVDFLANLAYNVTNINQKYFKTAIYSPEIDRATRLQWQYGCTRGVYATPSFTINDVFVKANYTFTVSQWMSLIYSGNR